MYKALCLAKEHWEPKWVYGEFFSKALITGENWTGFIETYGEDVGAIIREPETLISWEVDPKTVCYTARAFDEDNNEIFENDIITLETMDKKLTVVSYSSYLVPRPSGDIKNMTSLVCQDDEEKYYQLIQRSDGSWIFENSVKSTAIKIIGNKLQK